MTREYWKGRPILTSEDMAKMDCPFPPEPQWQDEFENNPNKENKMTYAQWLQTAKCAGYYARVKDGWEEEGQGVRVVGRPIFTMEWWVPVLFDNTNEPEWFLAEALEGFCEIDSSEGLDQDHIFSPCKTGEPQENNAETPSDPDSKCGYSDQFKDSSNNPNDS